MIDIKEVRESPDRMRAALSRRSDRYDPLIAELLAHDQRRRTLLQEVEALKAERNTTSEEVARRKKSGNDASTLLARMKDVAGTIKSLDQEVRAVDAALRDILLRLPNPPLADIPDGDAAANRIERSWGTIRELPFPAKAHWELGESLGLIDLPRGAKVSGSGFPVYVGQGAKLVRALVTFMLDLHTGAHGYREVLPPYLVNEESALGTGQLPDLEKNMYETADGLYLIPTAEVPVTNMHRDEILAPDDLPIGYAAWTPCFRREAGAHGKDTRGLIRVHQFDKVELVRFCSPQASPQEHETLLSHAEAVLQALELPYRIVTLAAGDLGFASAKTYDLEVWAAGVGTWLEASSVSTFTDFQARRANIRFRPEAGAKPEFVHTLNGSGVALPRTMIALLENNQQPDGSVRLPEALVPYFGAAHLTPGAEA